MASVQPVQRRLTSATTRFRIARLTITGALLIAAGFGVACTGDADKPASDSGTMADMPGMPGIDMPAAAEVRREGADSSAAAEVVFSAAQVKRGGVEWNPVTTGTAATTATIPGQVVPNEDRTARLGAPAGGRVVTVHVGPGDRVASGEILATLQSPEAGVAQSDLAKAQAEVASAQAQATYAKAARDRAERLLALKAIPRQEYERAVADDELARSSLAQAKAELRRARSTAEQLGAVSSASGEIAIRSSLDGVVLARTAVPGTVVEAGAPLVVVTDPSTLWLAINAPEKLASMFRLGGVLRFDVPAYPGNEFSARVTAIGAGLDPETRTLPVRGLITSGTRTLKPEMLASVTIAGAADASVVLVPEDAVQLLDGKSVVFVARPDTSGGARFTARTVEVGGRGGGRMSVVHGLVPGELVVIKGALTVKAQLKKGSMPMEM